MGISINDMLELKKKERENLQKELLTVEKNIREMEEKIPYVKEGQLIYCSLESPWGGNRSFFAVITDSKPDGVNYFSYIVCSGSFAGITLGCQDFNWESVSELYVPEEFQDNVRRAQISVALNGGL